jgi:hypothetical protein
MGFRATVDTGGFSRRADATARQASRAVLTELYSRYQASFSRNAWNWPRPTVRSDGSIVTQPRNLIDVGKLRQASAYSFLTPYTMEARWSSNYATAVHEGARLRNGTILPPRPWTSAVNGTAPVDGIPVYPLADRLGKVWLAYLNAGR